MAIKNPRKWRFTWEAQSHSPTLRLFIFDSQTNPSVQCQDLKVILNLSQSHVVITWVHQQGTLNEVSLLAPLPKVLIDFDSPISYRALSDHIEVKLLLLLPVDHPIVSSIDSVLYLTEDVRIVSSDVATPLVMDSDLKSLSAKAEGVHFYCRSCSTRLTRRPLRHFVEMPSVNWQEAADNWFGACCCSFGGISEKLVTRYANSYICVTDMCLLTPTTVTLFKGDLEGCKFSDSDNGQKYQPELDCNVEDCSSESTQVSGCNHGRLAGCDCQSDKMHNLNGKLRLMSLKNENVSTDLKCEVNEGENNGNNLFGMLPISDLSDNVASSTGCCVHTCEIPENCELTVPESSPLDQKPMRTIELMEDQRSFLNGFLGNIFMAKSYNVSKDINWVEYSCPQCSSLLGAYPCSSGDAPIDGGVRLFKCYLSTCLPVGGSGDMFRNYTLERMFTNQLLESAQDELSFRTVVRDLNTKSTMLQIVLINPSSWCCTGYCLGEDSSMEPVHKLDLHPIIKVLFSDCSSNSESQSRMLEEWLTKKLADEVFMCRRQIEELIEVLTSVKDVLPPSCSSIQGLPLSSMRR
ncbi:hypothetical protein Patl1_29022 [Pistacia atlantica]|uniref:Uncharacterized protein n=1 Tax=Pistacia atlantica TaxID=434234 RepID=A0ACC1BFI0_9ROSI|nr:hypothetical protein Patl1_29022 [Pistacia atlantica]